VLPPSTPDLLALELLDSIAELGSLGRAAARHKMSQPAVSMRMSQLERRLGASLLLRTPSGTRLTPAGERVVTLSRRVLAEAQAMMTAIEALVAAESSHLRVAASLTVAEHLLPGWLAALHQESPDVVLSVEVTNSAKVLDRVCDGLADVGFVEGHEHELPGLRAVPVRSDRLVVVVDPAHPWSHRTAHRRRTRRHRSDRARGRLGHPRNPGGRAGTVGRHPFPAGTRLVSGDPGRGAARRRAGGAERARGADGRGRGAPGHRAHRGHRPDQGAARGVARRPAARPAGRPAAQRRGVLRLPPTRRS